jgi:hypothetical protein
VGFDPVIKTPYTENYGRGVAYYYFFSVYYLDFYNFYILFINFLRYLRILYVYMGSYKDLKKGDFSDI